MPNSLHWLDGLVIVLYLLGVTALGIWSGRRVSRSQDFFMPRRFGKWMMIMHAFGTGTASDQAVTVAAATARNGLSGIWFQWMWLFSTPFYWLIAPVMRRFRATTTADIYALRYGRSVAVLFAFIGIIGMSVKIGVMLIGAGALIDAGTGGAIDAAWAIPIITVLFVVYGIAGGLGGAIVTDFVQGIMTIIFSFMLLPVVLNAVGGLSGMQETIAGNEALGESMLSLVAPAKINTFYVAMLSVNVLFLIVALPSAMGNCAAGRTEFDGRVGFMCGTFVKRICTIAWCLTALAALAWYVQNGVDPADVKPDDVYGDMAHRFLPGLMPGLLGVFIASLLAAVMSSCDSFMIASAGLFTENLYRPARPDRSEKHYLWVGRIASIVVVAGGIAFAFIVMRTAAGEGAVIAGLKIWMKTVAIMGIAFWLGFLWRRTTAAGAWASVLSGFATWFLITRGWFAAWLHGQSFAQAMKLTSQKGEVFAMNDAWQILSYLSIGVLAGVIVSLFTKPMPKERLDQFYSLTRTPIKDGEVIEKNCELPPGVEPAERKMLVQAGGLEIPLPSKTAFIGFAAGWLMVGLLIGGFVLLFTV
ncbi:MAG: sodium:solute symporter family protein [Verrucomicrobiales bacterium]|jgi:Na+/proline symporter|nr:sodium:solute symporter family protein [Verrucomicrobiales bacterium]